MTAPAESGTRWYLGEDGRVIRRDCPAGSTARVPAPDGARPIGADEAAERIAAIDEANRGSARERAERAALEAETDYLALLAVGVPARLAGKLTGHSPASGKAAGSAAGGG